MRVSSPLSGLVAHTYPPPTASPKASAPPSRPGPRSSASRIDLGDPAGAALVTQMAPSPERTSRGLGSTEMLATTRGGRIDDQHLVRPLAATQRTSRRRRCRAAPPDRHRPAGGPPRFRVELLHDPGRSRSPTYSRPPAAKCSGPSPTCRSDVSEPSVDAGHAAALVVGHPHGAEPGRHALRLHRHVDRPRRLLATGLDQDRRVRVLDRDPHLVASSLHARLSGCPPPRPRIVLSLAPSNRGPRG